MKYADVAENIRQLLADIVIISDKEIVHETQKQTYAQHASGDGIMRQLTYLQSLSPDKGYVFLQVVPYKGITHDEYREMRRDLLNVACGAAKNRFIELKVVIGIASEPPKYFQILSEDFALLECESWPDEQRNMYEEANSHLGFFGTGQFQQERF